MADPTSLAADALLTNRVRYFSALDILALKDRRDVKIALAYDITKDTPRRHYGSLTITFDGPSRPAEQHKFSCDISNFLCSHEVQTYTSKDTQTNGLRMDFATPDDFERGRRLLTQLMERRDMGMDLADQHRARQMERPGFVMMQERYVEMMESLSRGNILPWVMTAMEENIQWTRSMFPPVPAPTFKEAASKSQKQRQGFTDRPTRRQILTTAGITGLVGGVAALLGWNELENTLFDHEQEMKTHARPIVKARYCNERPGTLLRLLKAKGVQGVIFSDENHHSVAIARMMRELIPSEEMACSDHFIESPVSGKGNVKSSAVLKERDKQYPTAEEVRAISDDTLAVLRKKSVGIHPVDTYKGPDHRYMMGDEARSPRARMFRRDFVPGAQRDIIYRNRHMAKMIADTAKPKLKDKNYRFTFEVGAWHLDQQNPESIQYLLKNEHGIDTAIVRVLAVKSKALDRRVYELPQYPHTYVITVHDPEMGYDVSVKEGRRDLCNIDQGDEGHWTLQGGPSLPSPEKSRTR